MPEAKSRKPKSKVSKRSVKRVVSKTRKTTQKPSSKVRNYRKAYEACVEKAIANCAKRNKMVDKKSRKPRNTKSASKKALTKKTISTKSIKRTTKKDKGKNLYQEFVKKHSQNPDMKGLTPQEKYKKIGAMWRERE